MRGSPHGQGALRCATFTSLHSMKTTQPVRPISAARLARMTPINQRKAIARDVLARLKARQIKPRHRVWVRFGATAATIDGKVERDLQKLLRTPATCEVCALGGAMCAIAASEDHVKLSREWGGWMDGDVVQAHWNGHAKRRLTTIFGRQQLVLIEMAFENGGGQFRTNHAARSHVQQERLREAVDAFGVRYPDTRARFKAIFTQIAKTGAFTP